MRSVVCLLLGLCVISTSLAAPRCSFLDDAKQRRGMEFPNIDKMEVESYQMTVEYTNPAGAQSDYYVEYYDVIDRWGRVDIHQAGQSSSYVYRTASMESWEVTSKECNLLNITLTPNMLKDYQNDWRHIPDLDYSKATIGPSAMFKIALDVWDSKSDDMAYMGKYEGDIRGLKAHHWRRCDSASSYVDYFFTTDDDEGAFGLKSLKRAPLRVFFSGRQGESPLSKQQLEIMTFQPYISADQEPFQLPKGMGCRRAADLDDAPDLPDFSSKNLMFSAEVIYRKVDRTGDDAAWTSYYSTLMYALDLQSDHVSYYYTPWTSSKQEEPSEVSAPEYIIYDMKNKYAYKTSMESGSCEIIRERSFSPLYNLPENKGAIALDDPSILFPNNEIPYISEGSNRGLKVNVFEEVVKGYLINKNNEEESIDHAIITHSYLQDDEIERNVGSVKNALVQVQLLLYRDKDVEVIEMVTFNFFGFTTQLRNRRQIFNIARCFKNDDDYLWATIGFDADASQIQQIKGDAPSIQSNILNALTLKSELNAVRIPVILVDLTDSGVFVSMLVLNKPPVLLDFLEPESDSTITGSKDVEGVSNAVECANNCLEKEDNCWGFSICGAVCNYGVEKATVSKKDGCQLFRRYDNGSFVPSAELMAENLRREVESKDVHLMLRDKDDNMIQLDATSIEITEPGEDDRLFDQIGNTLNPRMRVLKAGYKLKTVAGNPVKNLGKIRYDECQRLCLDFKQCETMSFCLRNSECLLSSKYGDEIEADVMEEDNMCNLLTRKYGDHFERSPGNVLVETAQEVVDLKTTEECARACLTSKTFTCLSFDHCPADDKGNCKLHTVHYPNPQTREAKQQKSTNCGHYFRRFSTEFNKSPEKRSVGSKLPPVTNLTLEECSKSCMEYGKGTCYGFDFCQDATILATSCQILDTATIKTTYSPICSNFQRIGSGLSEAKPYTNAYAGGIGFLCFIIGLLLGAAVVFTIAYIRVNRRGNS